jgi:hypothetical protein
VPAVVPEAEAAVPSENMPTENTQALVPAPATAVTLEPEGDVGDIIQQAPAATENILPPIQSPPPTLIITPVVAAEPVPVPEVIEPISPGEEKKGDVQENENR